MPNSALYCPMDGCVQHNLQLTFEPGLEENLNSSLPIRQLSNCPNPWEVLVNFFIIY